MASDLMHCLISKSVFEIRWRSKLLICTFIVGKSDNLEMIKVIGEGKKFNDSLFWLGKAQLRDFFSLRTPFNSCAITAYSTLCRTQACRLEDRRQVVDGAPRTPAKKHGFWWSLEGFMVNYVTQVKTDSSHTWITNFVSPRVCYLLLMVCFVADGSDLGWILFKEAVLMHLLIYCFLAEARLHRYFCVTTSDWLWFRTAWIIGMYWLKNHARYRKGNYIVLGVGGIGMISVSPN